MKRTNNKLHPKRNWWRRVTAGARAALTCFAEKSSDDLALPPLRMLDCMELEDRVLFSAAPLAMAIAPQRGLTPATATKPAANVGTVASPSSNALQQFTTFGGQVLGFGQSSILVASPSELLQVNLVGANPVAPVAQGTSAQTGGSPGAAQTFAQVTYTDVWNGVTAVYAAQPGAIFEDSYNIAAGSAGNAASQIRLQYNAPVSLNAQGNLVIAFNTGTMTESAPVAWQEIGGQMKLVQVSFVLLGDNTVGFSLGAYDHSQQLVIDPTLTWNTFLGGSGGTVVSYAIALDSSGNVYVTGSSTATWGSPVQAYSAGTDAFAAELSSSGSLIWNSFLGGSGTDIGYGIAVDGSGNVYVTGSSTATWGSPVQAYSAGTDAFAAKLSSSGSLTWNTFLGGSGTDEGRGIAVDGSGNVYVAGYSNATWGTPVRAYSSGYDAFAAELSSSGSLTWNTFLGGSGTDTGYGIAVNAYGNLYVAGSSTATWGSPVQYYIGGTVGFVAELGFVPTTTVSPSVTPTTYGQSVTFTAIVAAPETPTGTVTFEDGGTMIGTGTLSSGSATFTTSALAAGTHTITAVYGGDSNYSDSTSSGVTETVTAATLTVTANNAGKVYGSVNPSFSDTITGYVNGD
ncbi:MAG: SBBP repeat-containing protein, partial [Thermoguttaceae bacterium]